MYRLTFVFVTFTGRTVGVTYLFDNKYLARDCQRSLKVSHKNYPFAWRASLTNRIA